ncbi:hypothetical protein SMCF_3751, partial [Streptomyces coelicoflavus ZG0656]
EKGKNKNTADEKATTKNKPEPEKSARPAPPAPAPAPAPLPAKPQQQQQRQKLPPSLRNKNPEQMQYHERVVYDMLTDPLGFDDCVYPSSKPPSKHTA